MNLQYNEDLTVQTNILVYKSSVTAWCCKDVAYNEEMDPKARQLSLAVIVNNSSVKTNVLYIERRSTDKNILAFSTLITS